MFLEFTDDSGYYYDYFYNATYDNWGGTPSTTPSSSQPYEVTYASGSPGTFSMKYSTGSAYSVQYQWVPSRLEVFGETLNYRSPNLGDHVPGDTSVKIHVNSVRKKVSGSWTDASLSYQAQGNGNYDTDNYYSPGYRIWDVRCSE